MGRNKKLGLTFYSGEDLKKVGRGSDGLFPIYITARYDSKKTTFKSPTASDYYLKQIMIIRSDDFIYKDIEGKKDYFIEKDTKILNLIKNFFDTYDKEEFYPRRFTNQIELEIFLLPAYFCLGIYLKNSVQNFLNDIGWHYFSYIIGQKISVLECLKVIQDINEDLYQKFLEIDQNSILLNLVYFLKEKDLTFIELISYQPYEGEIDEKMKTTLSNKISDLRDFLKQAIISDDNHALGFLFKDIVRD